jgi:integrase/recombinase XerC
MDFLSSEITHTLHHWMDTHIHRFSRHTAIAYHSDVVQFLNFLTKYFGKKIFLGDFENKLTHQDIRSWLSDRHQRNISNRSNARAMSAVKSFFQYLTDEKLISGNIFHQVAPLKKEKLLPRPLNEEETLQFINDIASYASVQWIGLRDRALFALIYSVGLRINEALQLDYEDTLSNHILILGKGAKERYIPLVPIVKEYIEAYQKICPYPTKKGTPLFWTIRGKRLSASQAEAIVANYRKLNLLPDSFTPHALRHSCATHLVAKTSDLRAVQELLGHASLSTTQIYTDIDQHRMLNAYNTFKTRE